MKVYFKCVLLFFIIVTVSACQFFNQVDDHPIKKASWLTGTWRGQYQQKLLTEIWRQQNDSTYTIKRYILQGTDTVLIQNNLLEQRDGNLYFTSTAKNEKAKHFKVTTLTAVELALEATKNGYTTKIIYAQIKQDSLLWEISITTNSGGFRGGASGMKKEK